MVVAIPIFLISDKKLWVIDEIYNPQDNVGKGNINKKYFTSKWPEMDSLNTKGNVKQKWGKRKTNKALLKTSLRFFWHGKEGWNWLPYLPKAEMANAKSYRNRQKLISHRSQPNDLHCKSIYWFSVRRAFAERFLEQTITIFKSSAWKKLWNILVMAECIEWLPTELTLHHHFDSIIPLVNIIGFLFVVVVVFSFLAKSTCKNLRYSTKN